jgi:hypothetical protein
MCRTGCSGISGQAKLVLLRYRAYALYNGMTCAPCFLAKFISVYVLLVLKAGLKMGVPYNPVACVCPRVMTSELFSDCHELSNAHTC